MRGTKTKKGHVGTTTPRIPKIMLNADYGSFGEKINEDCEIFLSICYAICGGHRTSNGDDRKERTGREKKEQISRNQRGIEMGNE